jgi:hypothetical protein
MAADPRSATECWHDRVTAQRGGSFREAIAMGKAYVEAREQHGKSELLDEIVAAKPERG